MLGLLLGVGSIFIFFPLLVRFLPYFKRRLATHFVPLSDIPGCPEHYDEALICALRTLPDPNNFLTVYSFVPLDEGVRFRHPKPPKCRYHSLSLYAGLYDPVQDAVPPSLADHELVYNPDGSFDVAICDEEDRPPDVPNWLPRQKVRDGLLVVRRYGTLPGQRVQMPAFYSMGPTTPRLIKPGYTSFSGPQFAEQAPNHRYHRMLRLLGLWGVAHLALLLVGRWSVAQLNLVVVLAAAVPFSFMHLLYHVGRRRASAMCAEKTGNKLHVFIDPSAILKYDNRSAKPHPQHKYYVGAYDTHQGDVVVSGRLFPGKQKMWTLVLYDEYGLPQPHNFTDETIETAQVKDAQGGQAYTLVLTKDVTRHPSGNVVDVSGFPKGVMLVRVIYPDTPAIFEKSKPSVEVVPVAENGTDKTKKA